MGLLNERERESGFDPRKRKCGQSETYNDGTALDVQTDASRGRSVVLGTRE